MDRMVRRLAALLQDLHEAAEWRAAAGCAVSSSSAAR